MRWSEDLRPEVGKLGSRTSLLRQKCGSGRQRTYPHRSLPFLASVLYASCAALPALGQAPPAPGAARFAVVLDAAHGGSDSGARLGTQAEKDLTLALSIRLRSLFGARGIAVVTTRESDTDIDAEHRIEIADRTGAAACLTLHAAPATANNPSSVHLFVSSLPPTPELRLAPWQSAQSAWIARSNRLAGMLGSALNQAGIPVTMGRAALPVMDSMTCPAVAVELAPQSGDAQSAPDSSGKEFQTQVAEALAAALVEWRSDSTQVEGPRP